MKACKTFSLISEVLQNPSRAGKGRDVLVALFLSKNYKVEHQYTTLLAGFQINTDSWSPFLNGPKKFSPLESHSKISNLMITELFYLHIIKMNRGSLHTRSFRHIHFSVLDTDELKMALRARKVSSAFEKWAPGQLTFY